MPCFPQGIFHESGDSMRYVRPSFYDRFSCIGADCKHNCCIGWEIDVDDDTAALYDSVGGELGKELSEKITKEGGRHFCLQPDGRCPFLNGQNLCRIILALGEDALCDICALHPRFYNSFPGREESGLGLCCEEAVRLLLSAPEGFCLIEDQDEEEQTENEWFEQLAETRDALFSELNRSGATFCERIESCCSLMRIGTFKLDLPEWVALYQSLEQMDPAWGVLLEKLAVIRLPEQWDAELNDERYGKLLSYFLYRHFLLARNSEEAGAVFAFCALSTAMIGALDTVEREKKDEHIRLYSAEIEYSDENVARICTKLRERFDFTGHI